MTQRWFSLRSTVHAGLDDGQGGTIAGAGRVLSKGTQVQVLSLEDDRAEVRSLGGYVATVNVRSLKEC